MVNRRGGARGLSGCVGAASWESLSLGSQQDYCRVCCCCVVTECVAVCRSHGPGEGPGWRAGPGHLIHPGPPPGGGGQRRGGGGSTIVAHIGVVVGVRGKSDVVYGAHSS